MISVLISVYKNETPKYFEEALLSIWEQQILKPSQVVLVIDGPITSDLNKIVDAWEKKLGEFITIVRLPINVGLGAALNEGLLYCKYELVARMDTDDISLPNRFSMQLDFMNNNLDIIASSAQMEEWSSDLTTLNNVRTLPTNPNALAKFAIRRSPLSHSVSIFRKTAILQVGGYPPLRRAQDHALWSLLLVKGYNLSNIPEVLLKMRAGDDVFSRRGLEYFKFEYQIAKFQYKIGFLGKTDFLINIFGKLLLRLSPGFIKKLAYKFAR